METGKRVSIQGVADAIRVTLEQDRRESELERLLLAAYKKPIKKNKKVRSLNIPKAFLPPFDVHETIRRILENITAEGKPLHGVHFEFVHYPVPRIQF